VTDHAYLISFGTEELAHSVTKRKLLEPYGAVFRST
jgi:hypothetical protein